MTTTLSRAEELRNDLDNLHFTKKYLIGVLAELEDLGRTNTKEFKRTEQNLFIVNNNIRRIEKELEKIPNEKARRIAKENIEHIKNSDRRDFRF